MKTSGHDAFENWVNESKAVDRLDEPLEGTDLNRNGKGGIEDSFLPENTPDWVRDLIRISKTEPKEYQVRFLVMELLERITRGSLLGKNDSPDRWIDESQKLGSDDPMKSWYLRQAATEYLVSAACGDTDAEGRAKAAIRGILGGDEALTQDIYLIIINEILKK